MCARSEPLAFGNFAHGDVMLRAGTHVPNPETPPFRPCYISLGLLSPSTTVSTILST
jgi:hypothetical protein